LRRFYAFFFIELERRRVHMAGTTAHPNGAWVTQQARTILDTLSNQGRRPRILIRDRDVKLTKAFDALFRSEGISVIHTPIAAPKAKAHAERWVCSVRRECLDRILTSHASPRTRPARVRRPPQHSPTAPCVAAASGDLEADYRRCGAIRRPRRRARPTRAASLHKYELAA